MRSPKLTLVSESLRSGRQGVEYSNKPCRKAKNSDCMSEQSRTVRTIDSLAALDESKLPSQSFHPRSANYFLSGRHRGFRWLLGLQMHVIDKIGFL